MSAPPSASLKLPPNPTEPSFRSPPVSSASVSSASVHSDDGKATVAPQQNGATKVKFDSDAPRPPSRKPTMTARLTGFLGGGKRATEAEAAKLTDKMRDVTVSGDSSAAPVGAKPPMPSRQPSTTGSSSNGAPKPEEAQARRFCLTPNGDHEHHLKVTRRNQKLRDMLRGIWQVKKEGPPAVGATPTNGAPAEHDGPAPLTLVADWVSQKRMETKAHPDPKGGPGQSMTLVEKYGKCQEIVGHGAFGIVRVAHKTDAKDPRREQLFAVKEFRQRPGESAKKYQKRLTSEFCLSSSMQHPNVIHTLDLLQDDKGDYCEVMEYCAGGDLYTLILAAGTLEVLEADCFFKQLMRGVEYMHEMGVAHRDLKPENLLLTQHGAIKITDFGNGECFRMAWEREAHMTAGLCGSAPYIAPEEYVEREFDPRAVDVWACGIIYMAMRTGRHLWRVAQKDEDEFFTRYLEDRKEESGFRPIEVLRRDTNGKSQRQCRNVVYSILDPNPTRRLTAHQVLQSEWVKDIKVCRAGDEGF